MYDLKKARDAIEIASEPADLAPEEEYEFYLKSALRTKADLLDEIRLTQRSFSESDTRSRSDEFYKRLNHLFDSFYEEVNSHLLMEPLDNFWGYAFSVRENEIILKLEHFMLLYDFVGDDIPESWKYNCSHFLACDDSFTILTLNAKLLTLDEYGKAYGVEAGTVRQWIRRGKLRSASKVGNVWRVSELAEKHEGPYSGPHYSWKVEIPDPPEIIPEINEADSLHIFKNRHTGEWTAQLSCFLKKGASKDIVLDNKEKEKLELYLISHPLIECINNYICEVRQKKGSEYEMLTLRPRSNSVVLGESQ